MIDSQEQTRARAKDIADAFCKIAVANHYMVTFNANVTDEELEIAKQYLIAWSNTYNNSNLELELALDLIEAEMKGRKL
jgi:hypothetical protein